jgi:hypothetical protein
METESKADQEATKGSGHLKRGVIKPCPLCKEKEELEPMDANHDDCWAVICWQCDYIGPIGDNVNEAIYLHNKAVL